MSPAHPSPEQTKNAEEKARKRDPHGTAPTDQAAEDHPAGAPTSDRQRTETAAGAQKEPGKNSKP
jgi:hypothetical protein